MKKDGLTNKEEKILDKVLDEMYLDKEVKHGKEQKRKNNEKEKVRKKKETDQRK